MSDIEQTFCKLFSAGAVSDQFPVINSEDYCGMNNLARSYIVLQYSVNAIILSCLPVLIKVEYHGNLQKSTRTKKYIYLVLYFLLSFERNKVQKRFSLDRNVPEASFAKTAQS